jgi:integrase
MEKILQSQGLITMIVKKNDLGSKVFSDFLIEFWDYDKSPYIQEKLSINQHVGKGRIRLATSRIKLYWLPYFKGLIMEEITRKRLKEFSIYLHKKYSSSLAPRTLKQIMNVGVHALRWAYSNEYISNDPTRYLPKYSIKQKDRGVLTPREAMTLFSLEWPDEQSFLINLIAMTTGLRIGEIIALHKEDIGEKYISVEHSYSSLDGLKSTKTDTPRGVPVIPAMREALLKMANKNPHDNGFIFFGPNKDDPSSINRPLFVLKKMLVKMKLGEELESYEILEGDSKEEKQRKRKEKKEAVIRAVNYWKKRNVVFHSWRHFYAARMTDKLEARKVMLATGHKNEVVFKGYSDHRLESDLEEVAETTGEVFGGLLPEVIIREKDKTNAAADDACVAKGA